MRVLNKLLLNTCVIAAGFCALAFAIKPEHDLNIVFIGDSITAGAVPYKITPGDCAADYLRQVADIKKLQTANLGISGFTTLNFLPGQDSFTKIKGAADNFIAQSSATLIFSIMLGTNDSAIKGPAGAPVSPNDFRHNLQLITDSLLAAYPNAKVIINYPIWYSDKTHNFSIYLKEGQQRILQYHKQIDTLVSAYKQGSIQQVFRGDTIGYGYFKENYLTYYFAQTGADGIFYLHPNPAGDKKLGEFWAKAILKVINQQ